ncbi:MAG TPA: ABC transporter ATP-binding protein [Thermoanaerobaculia bacterium]|nr:ABC transporter ATP-binding protein [Thermoanaerobaculia bacterium]
MRDLPTALQFESVTKRFGDTVAVSDVSLEITRASLVGLLGRNGAGKTTSINMATGLMRPSAGTIHVLGLDIESNSIEVKGRIGVMPQDDSLLEYLTGAQFLQFVGRVHGLATSVIGDRTGEIFETLELAPQPGTLVRDYSYGMKKKLALGAALIHGPELVFLDEPFEGIDPVTSRTIREILAGLQRKGVTIVMSSHVLEIVERLCDTIAIIDRGRLLAFGTLEDLRQRHGAFESLEELFVGLMGGAKPGELSWL